MFSEAVVDWLIDAKGNALQISLYLEGINEHTFRANAEKRDAVERCLERLSEPSCVSIAPVSILSPSRQGFHGRKFVGSAIAFATPMIA